MSNIAPAEPTDPAIEVNDLTKQYRDGVLANDAISIAIRRGAVFGLLGPNGAGKTTLVRQITGELRPSAGSVNVCGVDVLAEPGQAKRLMGVVPQEASPYLHLNPREHLTFFGRLHGLDAGTARRRSGELLAELGLEGHARVPGSRLSGGLKRKLLVANALVAGPPLLVLDEPTTGLDPHSRRDVWRIILSLHARGTTVLVTTHYMEEAETLCDEVAIIDSGRILARGTVDALRGRCRNRYKAVFEGDDGNHHQVIYGQSYEQVAEALNRHGVQEFSIAKTNLEDLYLELTARRLSQDEVPDA